MNRQIMPGPRTGRIQIPASKSQAHRLLICAALGEKPITLACEGLSKDIEATMYCLRTLGACITEPGPGLIRVTPLKSLQNQECNPFQLTCGESGSTLRFLLPVVGALGMEAVFHMEGRLPQRPLEPFRSELCAHGMEIQRNGKMLSCKGKLLPGKYTLPGDVSSQFVSGLLMALYRLEGDSTLRVIGNLESAPYVSMTEDALRLSGVRFEREGQTWRIPGGQRTALPEQIRVEGDYSNAAFFLCAGALSEGGIRVEGLNPASSQGDRAVLDCLRRFGARVQEAGEGVTVQRGSLHGIEIDAAPIPDLIPVLSVVAALSYGQTWIVHAGRLRLKESDRLESVARMLNTLGARVEELPDGLLIYGVPKLRGGSVDACGDHRIAMSAAVAACAGGAPVDLAGSECVQKSYPGFWEDFETLKGE